MKEEPTNGGFRGISCTNSGEKVDLLSRSGTYEILLEEILATLIQPAEPSNYLASELVFTLGQETIDELSDFSGSSSRSSGSWNDHFGDQIHSFKLMGSQNARCKKAGFTS